MIKKTILCIALSALYTSSALAAITTEEAKRLNKDLTPLGAERVGNAAGTIPEWTGGITTALPGWPNKKNDRPNPYPEDKPLFTITSDNMEQYSAHLTPGTKAMFKAYPEQFKMNIYPSRRTAAFPQKLYDEISAQATTAQLSEDGNSVTGVWGAIPFPIPANGNEAIWNHLLRYQGYSRKAEINENVIYDNGKSIDSTLDTLSYDPFYDKNAAQSYLDKRTFSHLVTTADTPARDAGEGYLVIDQLDMTESPRKAWIYDPGERRVRRAPNLSFDTPDRPINVIDDFQLFSGSPERYNWKLVGKKEMYIPYNNNKVNSPSVPFEDAAKDGFLDHQLIRYELHRVWEVEATVKEGERHLYKKRVSYLDEDSWGIVATDKYDGNDNLWRIGFYYPIVASEIPLTGTGMYAQVDLKKGGYYIYNSSTGRKGWEFNFKAPKPSYFTPAASRRRGR